MKFIMYKKALRLKSKGLGNVSGWPRLGRHDLPALAGRYKPGKMLLSARYRSIPLFLTFNSRDIALDLLSLSIVYTNIQGIPPLVLKLWPLLCRSNLSLTSVEIPT